MSNENTTVQPVCDSCKVNPPESGYAYPLCPKCRQTLMNRPYPNWIKVVMLMVGVLIIISAFNLPTALQAGNALSTAKKAEAISDYTSAILEYQKIIALYPESQEHKARLAICYMKTNDLRKASDIINSIDEKKLSQKVVVELNDLMSKLK